jgi:predicted metalloprotease
MRWESGRRSDNVEDRRGMGAGTIGGGLGLGGLLLVLVISLLTGVNPLRLLGPAAEISQQVNVPSEQGGAPPANDPQASFVQVVLADTEDVWSGVFQQMGRHYDLPKLVLFSDRIDSACGMASSAVGPFYCPPDQKVYIDLSFFRELDQRFGAPGDFAQAYVIAHEVGHHVQNELGISTQVDQLRSRASETQGKALSVRLELQADCLAGVWGYHSQKRSTNIKFDPGDLEEGLRAAAAIGDDRLQREAQGYVVPESFTHGSSQQRVDWLRRGLQSGDISQCDTFGKT